MKELIRFVEGLKKMEFEVVAMGNPFESEIEIINVEDLLARVQELGIEEVVAEYYESFEFIDECGNYLEINVIR